MRSRFRGRASPALFLLLLAACGREESPAAEPAALGATHLAAVQRGAPAAHRATLRPAGLRIENPARGLRAEFTPLGAAVTPPGGAAWAFNASASRFGCEGELRALPTAAAEARDDRVEYARGALREWYVNGPAGLEQGFTLPAPPPCARVTMGGLRWGSPAAVLEGPLPQLPPPQTPWRGRVVIELGEGLDAQVSADGQEARLLDASGREALRYTDLHVVDAAGRRLPAELAPRPGGLSIRLDDAGAVYPLVVDPLIWGQQAELTPGDPMANSYFGLAVSVSGGTILVGAEEQGTAGQGAAYVFALEGGSWVQQQEFVAADAMASGLFGASVSVSGDTAIVGSPGAQTNRGAAYVFVRSGGLWSQQQELTPWDGTQNSRVGAAVAVDGDTAVVGSPDSLLSQPGAAYVFTRSGTVWTEQQLTVSGIQPGDRFGASVAVSGTTVVVGAPGHANGQGAAYVFVLSGGAWSLQSEFDAFDGSPADLFGASVAVNGDTAIVGAPMHQLGQVGIAYVFTRTGFTWAGSLELSPSSPPFGFGNTVAFDGETALVGSIVMPPAAGTVHAFSRTGPLWTDQVLFPSDGMPGDTFGTSVAVDGTSAVIGAANTAAYVFGLGSANGDACTSAAACASGKCTDGVCCEVAACPPPNACQTATSCQASTGKCEGTPKPDGVACDDGDACSHGDSCAGGACIGQSAKTCPPVNECHDFGFCDAKSGDCFNPVKPDGQPCTDGVCKGGVCVQPTAKTPAQGCGCEVGGEPPGGAAAMAAGLLLMARRRREARRGRRDP